MIFTLPQNTIQERAKLIRLLLLDVDGVLTDGQLYFSNSGEEIKAFNSLDGHGIRMLKRSGIEVGIITGRKSALVQKRATDLGIALLYQGREDKLNALNEILASSDYDKSHIAYMGDDFPDAPVLKTVAIGITVPNGHPDLVDISCMVTSRAGGAGAVREVCDFLLKAQDNYPQFLV